MSTNRLLEKIEALPPEKRAEVEDLIDRLESRPAQPAQRDGQTPDPLIERVRARRERLLREHGLFDTSTILRKLREEGDE